MAEGIVFQNKDVEFKLLSESYREKSFEAYGLKLPRIQQVLPTNLPQVAANEKHMDNLFLLEDGTLAVVDYESEDKAKNRIKYINYIGRVMERAYRDTKKMPSIRLIVIYTGDVEKAQRVFRMPCMTLTMEQVFIAELPKKEIYRSARDKLERNVRLTEKDLMQLIILPLAEKGKENKQKRIEEVIGLAKRIKEETDQIFVLTGLLVSTDKFISEKSAETIRRLLDMTKVGRMLFEEGMAKGIEQGRVQGIEQGIEQGRVQGIEQGMEKGLKEGKQTALQLVSKVIIMLKKEPGLTNKEIAETLYCDETDVDFIRRMYR